MECPLDVQSRPEVDSFGAGSELPHGQQTCIPSMLDRTAQLVLINGAASYVNERTQSCRGPETRMLGDVFWRKGCDVEDHRIVTGGECRWHRQMDPWRLQLADAVDCQCAFMGHDRPAPGPKSPADQIVVELGDPFREPEQASVDSQPVAGGNMVRLRLVGVPDHLSLCRTEVATLLGRKVKQSSAKISAVSGHESILYRN
jgi:hypothetical protein